MRGVANAEAIHSTSSLRENSQDSRGNPQNKNKHIDCHEPKGSRNDDTSKLEQEIDTLVYALYDLNESEIALINKLHEEQKMKNKTKSKNQSED